MKKAYLTEQEIDEITAAIYNDTLETLYESVPETVEDDFNREVVKEVFKDEEYKRVEDSEFVITRQGRIFNSKTIKFRRPSLTGSSLFFLRPNNKRVDMETFFEDNGWTFDLDEVVKRYKKKKWGITILNTGRSYFRSL